MLLKTACLTKSSIGGGAAIAALLDRASVAVRKRDFKGVIGRTGGCERRARASGKSCRKVSSPFQCISRERFKNNAACSRLLVLATRAARGLQDNKKARETRAFLRSAAGLRTCRTGSQRNDGPVDQPQATG